MIISKTPFRISFSGGGSDIPSFYRKEMGAVLSSSIDKYVYLAVHPFFNKDMIQLKYSETELINNISEINHPIFREVLRLFNLKGIDLNSIADIPAGTGLGSSSSFTVGLINAVNAYLNKSVSAEYLGKLASKIEIDILKNPIGKQDQYAAAYGGLNFITFYPDETVNVEKIIMDKYKKIELQDNLIMIYTGNTRSANNLLATQTKALNDSNVFTIQKKMVELAFNLKKALESNEIDDFGSFLHEGWILKRSLTKTISNSKIDYIYSKGLNAGALGGKLLGAGGSGFLLFYCPKEKHEEFRTKMSEYEEMNFKFDNFGSKIIYLGE